TPGDNITCNPPTGNLNLQSAVEQIFTMCWQDHQELGGLRNPFIVLTRLKGAGFVRHKAPLCPKNVLRAAIPIPVMRIFAGTAAANLLSHLKLLTSVRPVAHSAPSGTLHFIQTCRICRAKENGGKRPSCVRISPGIVRCSRRSIQNWCRKYSKQSRKSR